MSGISKFRGASELSGRFECFELAWNENMNNLKPSEKLQYFFIQNIAGFFSQQYLQK